MTRPTSRTAAPTADTDPDRDFCVALLPEVSRTFALSIEMLPDALRDAVRVSYLLCRVVDTIEDEPGLRPTERVALFDAFDAVTREDALDPGAFAAACRALRLGATEPEGRLCAGADALFRAYRALPAAQREAVRPHVLEMSHGMRLTCARADGAGGVLRLDDVPDLERYCYYVAGTVGELLTRLFEQAVPGLSEHARQRARAKAVSFGIGLQIVNIVKDVAQDAGRGVCYLPRAVAFEHGLDLSRVLEPASREAGLAVVRELCGVARAHLARAREYVSCWPAEGDGSLGVRLFCAVPLALALATLREVEEGDDTLRAGAKPKVSRATVAAIVEDACISTASDVELARLFDRCLGVAPRAPQPVHS